MLLGRLTALERGVLDGLLRGDSPAQVASALNYSALGATDDPEDDRPLAGRVTADQVGSAAARVRRKAQQLAAVMCPGLEDRLFAAV